MKAAIAAGHPATVAAGVEILEAGGSAADAAVAASLASCVAETVMTGLLGGGHAIYYEAESARAQNLDCFVAVPGLGAERREVELLELDVPFGAELVHYAVGIASCGVPGVPAGLDELWRRHGRIEWPRLVEPALRLARSGVEMPPAHASCLAMLAPVMTMNEGARIYAPGGSLLAAGDRLEQPGLVRAFELLAAEGAVSAYTGSIAESMLTLMAERGGLVTADDLRSYRATWGEPVEADYRDWTFYTRGDLSGLPEVLPRIPRLAGLDEPDRALALARLLSENGADGGGDTTNITVVDHDGNACVLTTSLGLGSGDFLAGLDAHLNSMLGETDLVRGVLEPGDRMGSMMAPSVALRDGSLVLAIGAAGGTRLRGALVQVTAGVLDEGLPAEEAVGRPRLHAAGARVQVEPGFSDSALAALERAGFAVRVWPARHHFFGGVSLVTPNDAAGDPRRSGAASRVPLPTTS
ncbi:MAG TPA: gamma-glutamyltransferase [Gaiellaceae bacterium]|nr:gamma-glutamyltransferase [Gaiellaceae bacterium]